MPKPAATLIPESNFHSVFIVGQANTQGSPPKSFVSG